VREHKAGGAWADRELKENQMTTASIEKPSSVSLSRRGQQAAIRRIIAALGRLDFTKMSPENKLPPLAGGPGKMTSYSAGRPPEENPTRDSEGL